ncbi:hypothetical protein HDU98_000891 [Podochytrium sp. JEL0797]|nr:hypothetical protein HDU98_000891 [Podochytrium sp. JEL0797]
MLVSSLLTIAALAIHTIHAEVEGVTQAGGQVACTQGTLGCGVQEKMGERGQTCMQGTFGCGSGVTLGQIIPEPPIRSPQLPIGRIEQIGGGLSTMCNVMWGQQVVLGGQQMQTVRQQTGLSQQQIISIAQSIGSIQMGANILTSCRAIMQQQNVQMVHIVQVARQVRQTIVQQQTKVVVVRVQAQPMVQILNQIGNVFCTRPRVVQQTRVVQQVRVVQVVRPTVTVIVVQQPIQTRLVTVQRTIGCSLSNAQWMIQYSLSNMNWWGGCCTNPTRRDDNTTTTDPNSFAMQNDAISIMEQLSTNAVQFANATRDSTMHFVAQLATQTNSDVITVANMASTMSASMLDTEGMNMQDAMLSGLVNIASARDAVMATEDPMLMDSNSNSGNVTTVPAAADRVVLNTGTPLMDVVMANDAVVSSASSTTTTGSGAAAPVPAPQPEPSSSSTSSMSSMTAPTLAATTVMIQGSIPTGIKAVASTAVGAAGLPVLQPGMKSSASVIVSSIFSFLVALL